MLLAESRKEKREASEDGASGTAQGLLDPELAPGRHFSRAKGGPEEPHRLRSSAPVTSNQKPNLRMVVDGLLGLQT